MRPVRVAPDNLQDFFGGFGAPSANANAASASASSTARLFWMLWPPVARESRGPRGSAAACSSNTALSMSASSWAQAVSVGTASRAVLRACVAKSTAARQRSVCASSASGVRGGKPARRNPAGGSPGPAGAGSPDPRRARAPGARRSAAGAGAAAARSRRGAPARQRGREPLPPPRARLRRPSNGRGVCSVRRRGRRAPRPRRRRALPAKLAARWRAACRRSPACPGAGGARVPRAPRRASGSRERSLAAHARPRGPALARRRCT